MIKLLHSADWHMDSPLPCHSEEQSRFLKEALLQVPRLVVQTAQREGCQLILLSGDIFDGPCSPESLEAVTQALAEADMPVVIAPGNHDPYTPDSPWQRTVWPDNVHIFDSRRLQSVHLPELDCRIYGAAFTGPYEEDWQDSLCAADTEAVRIGVLHGDPTQADSPYRLITAKQILDSGLDYLALGHIHKQGQLVSGGTLCAWPGCPMGRGFDELGQRGVLVVTVADQCSARFVSLNTPRFYDLECEAGTDPAAALSGILPPAGTQDFFRVTFTGECDSLDTAALAKTFSHFPNLALRDRTVPPTDLWATAGDDT